MVIYDATSKFRLCEISLRHLYDHFDAHGIDTVLHKRFTTLRIKILLCFRRMQDNTKHLASTRMVLLRLRNIKFDLHVSI
jgi:hypothetical protein